MTPPTYRDLSVQDGDLLELATLANLNWCGERFTRAEMLERADFAHYTRLVPERGDLGVVAERDGQSIGVAWVLLLPADDPGYGYVDESTPEVSLWVAPSARRQGVGRALMRRLEERCAAQGITRLTLSVEDGNHARDLYLSEGYQPVPGREPDGVLVKELGSFPDVERLERGAPRDYVASTRQVPALTDLRATTR